MVIPPNNSIGKSANGTSSSQAETVNKGRQDKAAENSSPAKQADATDEVTVSQQGAKLAKLETQVRSQSGVDEARVAATREAIENGSYKIDSESLSKSLLESEDWFQ